MLVRLYHEGEYLDYWISPYISSLGHSETVVFTFEDGYPNGNYEIKIGAGDQLQFSEEFQIV